MPLHPLPANANAWPPTVVKSAAILNSIYSSAEGLLSSRSFSRHQIEHHLRHIVDRAFPIFEGMNEAIGEDVPAEWLRQSTKSFVGLVDQFVDAWKDCMDDLPVGTAPNLVKVQRTGKPGRPKIIIDHDLLHAALGPQSFLTKTELARSLGVSDDTVLARAKELGLEERYSAISDQELDALVDAIRKSKPNLGFSYIQAGLSKDGVRVTHKRLWESIRRVDMLGLVLRRHRRGPIRKRTYIVEKPNSMWHMDGHHKLIRWGIVIHGVVDGYSRKLTGIRARTNNRADTVLDTFLDAIMENGVPSRVRGDRGGENRDVSILMLLLRGLNRASFVWGPSVFNTRIERMWVEVGRFFGLQWRAFLTRLELHHQLDINDPRHLWILHKLFLSEIDKECQEFKTNWNLHRISGKGVNRAPNDLLLTGLLDKGLPVDHRFDGDFVQGSDIEEGGEGGLEDGSDNGMDVDSDSQSLEEEGFEETDEDEEEGFQDGEDEYLEGLEEEHISDQDEDGSQNGDDSSDSEHEEAAYDSNDPDDLVQIQEGNLMHEAVPVPAAESPFLSDEGEEALWTAIDTALDHEYVPDGYSLKDEEWAEEGGYPSTEFIRRGGKGEMEVELPVEVWRPRALLWVLALDRLRFLEHHSPQFFR